MKIIIKNALPTHLVEELVDFLENYPAKDNYCSDRFTVRKKGDNMIVTRAGVYDASGKTAVLLHPDGVDSHDFAWCAKDIMCFGDYLLSGGEDDVGQGVRVSIR